MTVMALTCGFTATTWALPIAIVNSGFETDAAADSDGINGAVTGWDPTGFGVRLAATFDPSAAGGAIFTGENNYFALQASSNPGGPLGGVSFATGSQTVPTTILANMRYTLSVEVAHDLRFPFPSNVPSNDTYGANFNDGNPIVLSRLIATNGLGFAQIAGVTLASNTAATVPGGESSLWTLVYETGDTPDNLGSALAIQLFVQSNTAGGQQTALFDNVSLDVTAVPEPSTLALLGVGGAALVAFRRFRKTR